MADVVIHEYTNKNRTDSQQARRKILSNNSIKLCPLNVYMSNDEQKKISETLALPVSPSEIMFNNDSDSSTLKLMNYGELPVNMNRKLATWTLTSMFMNADKPRYWFDTSNDNGQVNWKAYDNYCAKLYNWKIQQTPLVFMYKTWGEYYYCQIKDFKFGNKDSTGNVYYELQFQEYKKYDRYDISYYTTNYEDEYYEVKDGETLLTLAKRFYGVSDAWETLMDLNGMVNPEVKPGDRIKIK